MVAQSVFHPSVKHTHTQACICTILSIITLHFCFSFWSSVTCRVFHINNTLLSFGWMGMCCWLRWELPDLYLFEKFPHFPHGMSERWRGLLYQWRLTHQIAAEHQRSWIIPVKVPGKWQFECVLSSFGWYAYSYGDNSGGMIYQSLMETIKLWKEFFPLVVWSGDGVTVTHACMCLICFDTWAYFLLNFFFLRFF